MTRDLDSWRTKVRNTRLVAADVDHGGAVLGGGADRRPACRQLGLRELPGEARVARGEVDAAVAPLAPEVAVPERGVQRVRCLEVLHPGNALEGVVLLRVREVGAVHRSEREL